MDTNREQGLTACKVKDLSGSHIGRTVTIRAEQGAITGTLSGVSHQSAIVSDARWGYPDQKALGKGHATVTFLEWGASDVNPDTAAEVYPLR